MADLRVGSYLVDSNQIYIISRIDSERIHYRPTSESYSSVTGSFPQKNFSISGYRLPLTTTEIDQLLSDLRNDKTKKSEPIDPKFFKETISLNNPFKTIIVLKQLWILKSATHTTLSGTYNDIYQNILKHLSTEISLVTGFSIDKSTKKILSALAK